MFYDDKMLTRLGWEEELRRQSLETFEVSVPGQAPGSPDTRRCSASRRTSSGRGWGTWATGSRRRWSTWQLSPSPSLLYSGEMRDTKQNYFPPWALITCSAATFCFLVPLVIEPAVSTIQQEFLATSCTTTAGQWLEGKNKCDWSSCREGCTKEIFHCWKVSR